jgi:hypothetical protein
MAKGNGKFFDDLKGVTLPDLNRLYLIEKAQSTFDPVEKELLEALLEGYDSGQLIMSWDPFTMEMKYKTAELN